jgi:hypothetical protein
MGLPGEGDAGAQHNQLSEEVYLSYLNGLDEAGWFSGGGWGDGLPVQIGIMRREGRGSLGLEAAIDQLGLQAEDGEGLVPGYDAKIDEETGLLALGYEGPANARYERFLGDMIRLGHSMDEELIARSPYPQAMGQWRMRHMEGGWAQPRIFQSLDGHLDENLTAIRDHVVFQEGGVGQLQALLHRYNGMTRIGITPDKVALATVNITLDEVLADPSEENKDDRLDLALQQLDGAVKNAVEVDELGLLRDSDIAEAYIREVLVDDPKFGVVPLSEEAFQDAINFSDGPERGRGEKLTLLAQATYYSRSSISPKGIHMLLDSPIDTLGGKTARQIIDSGSQDEIQTMMDHRRGLRGMTAS